MKTFFTIPLLFLVYFLNAQSECFEECFYDPNGPCSFIFDPVCGCDGVQYSNSCIALNSGIPAWTDGACGAGSCLNEINILSEFSGESGTDDEPQSFAEAIYCFSFESTMPFTSATSYAWSTSHGQTAISADPCFSFQTISDGQPVYGEYTITLSVTSDNCTFVHNIKLEIGGAGDCPDLADVDFGECEAILGFSTVNNSCVAISGCSTVGSDNVDYSEFFYEDYQSCDEACGSCINPDQINPEILCPTVVDPVCGCDGLTYNNSCEAENYFGVTSYTEGPCAISNSEPCDDLGGIDFGVCDLYLGVAMLNGLCTNISGCGTTVGGVDYSGAFFTDMFECVQCEQNECINPQQINPDFGCDTDYAPVCGCDSVTYSNSCVAIINGVTSWQEGPCSVNSIENNNSGGLGFYPNPASDILTITFPLSSTGRIEITDELGRTLKVQSVVSKQRDQLDLSGVKSGNYFLVFTPIKSNIPAVVSRLVVFH